MYNQQCLPLSVYPYSTKPLSTSFLGRSTLLLPNHFPLPSIDPLRSSKPPLTPPSSIDLGSAIEGNKLFSTTEIDGRFCPTSKGWRWRSESEETERSTRTIVDLLRERTMDGDDRFRRRKSLQERLGLKSMVCCGSAWGIGIGPSTMSTRSGDDDDVVDSIH
ncbi:unnamed protein product [Lactuca virosa]|uniref:Uncharacterized protein n=1 Tax=Lactuca virosa TaxID=75947 RepID=A0AAU9MCL4_9ASTR|nr:unnamed protein product [Lactuca virosa]